VRWLDAADGRLHRAEIEPTPQKPVGLPSIRRRTGAHR
jgi:hypothetical protein